MDAVAGIHVRCIASVGVAAGRQARRTTCWLGVGEEQQRNALCWKRDASFLRGERTFLMPESMSRARPSRGGRELCRRSIRAFTDRQESLVTESWELLRKDAEQHALAFFLRIFEIAPVAKRLFSFLQHSNLPLESNPKLQAHALQVFVITCEAAMSLRNKEKVSTPGSTLKNMAHAHALAGVVDEHYDVVKFCLLKTIKEGLPAEKWSEEVKEAWTEAYDELVKAIKAETEGAVTAAMDSRSSVFP